MKRSMSFFGFAALFGLVRCVDLFHSTDFADPPPSLDTCRATKEQIRSQALDVCLRIASCLGPLGNNSVGRCLVDANQAYDCRGSNGFGGLGLSGSRKGFWDCVAKNQECAGIARCLSGGDPIFCDEGNVTTGCGTLKEHVERGIRFDCPNALASSPHKIDGRTVAWAENCSRSGQVCSEGACVGTGSTCQPGCDQGVQYRRCSADPLVRGDRGASCKEQGAGRCDESLGVAGCVSNGSTCAPNRLSVTCNPDDGVITGCPFGALETFSCTAFDPKATCTPMDDAGGVTLAGCNLSGAACEQDHCGGDGILEACVLGHEVGIDCKAHGFSTCADVDTLDGRSAICK